MAATSAARWMERRYYIAMAVPFLLDVVITVTFSTILGLPQLMLQNLATGIAALLIALHIGARLLFRPIHKYLAGEGEFAAIERRLTQLPLRSASLAAYCYLPILLWRIMAPLLLDLCHQRRVPRQRIAARGGDAVEKLAQTGGVVGNAFGRIQIDGFERAHEGPT